MINERMIEAAATAYAKETWNHEEDQFMCIDGFKAGAKWMQQEFVKNLWYASIVEAEPRRDIIAISEKGMVYALNFEYDDDWRAIFRRYNIERWCYLSEILPKGGEE